MNRLLRSVASAAAATIGFSILTGFLIGFNIIDGRAALQTGTSHLLVFLFSGVFVVLTAFFYFRTK